MAPIENDAAYTAVVSGASGYIGTELVQQLLEKGYAVRGTVRSTSNTDKTLTKLAEVRCCLQAWISAWLWTKHAISMHHVQALPGKLSLHEADLLKDGFCCQCGSLSAQ